MLKTAKGLEISIRWLIRRDMPEVFSIERRSFEFPWCEEKFLEHLRRRNCIGLVVECSQQIEILAFMI